MTETKNFLGCGIYYETRLSIRQQLDLLKPLLVQWIGHDYMRHYNPEISFFNFSRPDDKVNISVGWNSGYNKSYFNYDRFHFVLDYFDETGTLTEEQYLHRITQALELFWSHGIPTCTPDWEEELPNAGGENGPVEWPP